MLEEATWTRSDPAPATPPGRLLFVRERQLVARLVRKLGPRGRVEAARRFLDEEFPGNASGRLAVYLESRCAQACRFCTLPLTRGNLSHRVHELARRVQRAIGLDLVGSGWFAALIEAATEREQPPALVVTGNDWASAKKLAQLLALLEGQSRAMVTFQGPSTRLSDTDLARRVASLPTLERVTLTLLAADPTLHDAVTGSAGSGVLVQRAIGNLLACGAPIAVNVVLTAWNVEDLPATLQWLAERTAPATLLMFIPDRLRHRGWDPGALMPPLDCVRLALERHLSERGSAPIEKIHGVPLCAVPPALRPSTFFEWQSADREPLVYPPACTTCSGRAKCTGLPAAYVKRLGERGVKPLR